jgi:YD repeat-containing protein
VAHQYLDPAHAHAVTHLGGSPNYTYDATGNMLTRSEAGVTYSQAWDAENRLQSVAVGGQTTTFTYDGDGRRVKKQDASGTTIYIGQYYEVTGSSIRKYYSLSGQRLSCARMARFTTCSATTWVAPRWHMIRQAL